jgi:DNA-binding transcriptional ArsR family regulator
MSRRGTLWISRPEHVEALASPMRQRIVDRIEALGPSAIRELALSLDVAADSLYYHVRRLQGIGLLSVGSRRQGGSRRSEAVVSLAAPRWHIAYEPRNARAVLKVGRVILRQAQRDFALGVRQPQAVTRGALRNLWALRLESSLGPADVRRINRHLAGILKVLRGARRNPSRELMAVSWVLAPIPSRNGERRGASRPRGTRIQGAQRNAR